jgi:CHAT domain-containing protein/predicted negative regulator of RcsB-dependent stress response
MKQRKAKSMNSNIFKNIFEVGLGNNWDNERVRLEVNKMKNLLNEDRLFEFINVFFKKFARANKSYNGTNKMLKWPSLFENICLATCSVIKCSRELKAYTYQKLGTVFLIRGKSDIRYLKKAKTYLLKSLNIITHPNNFYFESVVSLGTTYHGIATQVTSKKKKKEYLLRAIDLYSGTLEKYPSENGISYFLIQSNLGSCIRALCDFEQHDEEIKKYYILSAIKIHKKLYRNYPKSKRHNDPVRFKISLDLALDFVELAKQEIQPEAKKKYFKDAIKVYRRLLNKFTDSSHHSDIFYNQGLLYKHMGDYDAAIRNFQQAKDLFFKDTGSYMLAVFELARSIHAKANEANLAKEIKHDFLRKALSYYDEACTMNMQLPQTDSTVKEIVGWNAAEILDCLGMREEAIARLKELVNFFHEKKNWTEFLNIMIKLANLLFRNNDYEEAFQHLTKVYTKAKELKKFDQIVECTQLLGDYFFKKKEHKEALHYYQESLQNLFHLRCLKKMELSRLFSLDEQTKIFDSLINIHLKRLDNKKAWRYASLPKSRLLLDFLKIGKYSSDDLRNLFQNRDTMAKEEINNADWKIRCFIREKKPLPRRYIVTESDIIINNLKRWGEPLEERRPLLIEYYFLEIPSPKMLIFLIPLWKKSFRVVERDFSLSTVYELLSRINQFVQKNERRLEEYKSPLGNARLFKEIYNNFISPYEDHLKEIMPNEIWFVTHYGLNLFPIHAGLDKHGIFFIEKYPVLYLPSTELPVFIKPKTQGGIKNEALIIANPNKTLGSLGDKSNDIKKLLEKESISTVLIKENKATKKNFIQSLRNLQHMTILHFFTHCSIKDWHNFLTPEIILNKSSLSIFDILYHPDIIFKNDLFVFLGSCDTNLSYTGKPFELFSLASAFLAAGACSVISAIYPSCSKATGEISLNFYKNYFDGEIKIRALHNAILNYMDKYNSKQTLMNSVYEWIPLILMGSPI